MKKMTTIIGLMIISSTVFAANCDKEALDIAKMNLDSKARSYQFPEGDIMTQSLKKISSKKNGSLIYSVGSYIYKSEYNIRVQLDSSCSVESVRITEVSR